HCPPPPHLLLLLHDPPPPLTPPSSPPRLSSDLRAGRKMQTSPLQLRCDSLRLLKTCPPCLKAEPHYPPASSRLDGNRPWPRSIIKHLEEAISLLDGRHFLVRTCRSISRPRSRQVGFGQP